MPELPEVETVVNSLKDLIIGKRIVNVEVFYPEMIKNVSSIEKIQKIYAVIAFVCRSVFAFFSFECLVLQ